jgi:hypothetical protein
MVRKCGNPNWNLRMLHLFDRRYTSILADDFELALDRAG